jgi:hypothetical protein
MWRFIDGVAPPQAKKKKTQEEKLEQQRQYETINRTRDFLPEWHQNFCWLRYDSQQRVMHCLYCPEYDSRSFKKDTLTKHDVSKR